LSNVGHAYRYLINVYEEGDNVFLFGFSRGAYTVRALGGVLHMYGLLRPGNDGLIPYIIAMYAKKTRNPAPNACPITIDHALLRRLRAVGAPIVPPPGW